MDISPMSRNFLIQATGARLPIASYKNRMVARLEALGLVKEVTCHGKQVSWRATTKGWVECERAKDRLRDTKPLAMEDGKIIAWTDYPLIELGDIRGQEAPVRKVEPVSYDGDKYVVVRFKGLQFSFKGGYLYAAEGRCGKVPVFNFRKLPFAVDEICE